jgi:hypothetical protein
MPTPNQIGIISYASTKLYNWVTIQCLISLGLLGRNHLYY